MYILNNQLCITFTDRVCKIALAGRTIAPVLKRF